MHFVQSSKHGTQKKRHYTRQTYLDYCKCERANAMRDQNENPPNQDENPPNWWHKCLFPLHLYSLRDELLLFFPTNLSCLFNVIVAFCWEHARKKHIMRLLRLDMWNRIQQLNQQEKQIANIIKYEVKRDSIVGWLKRGSR